MCQLAEVSEREEGCKKPWLLRKPLVMVMSTKSSSRVMKTTVEGTEAALGKMKPDKATGLDDLAPDLWKSKLWHPAEWLAKLFNQVVKEKKVLERWHNSTTISIWKKKGSPADCSNYRPIPLLSHSMRIFERLLDRRIPKIVKLSDNQCGIVFGCGTIDAIHAVHLLVKKHREKQRPVHIAFLDLEKASDRVPREVIWLAMLKLITAGFPGSLQGGEFMML
ncbi:unnamed protein product [Heligmosomoides polygyrus]|uniref:Reverse transcriptase domain-containing protein n=1 Tax=Heligmosomoides polygyrus TaxID=6339 RepID=A0A183F269_HELPZ|nr:unnamed protein product [Heligmosomoides polygyrus]